MKTDIDYIKDDLFVILEKHLPSFINLEEIELSTTLKKISDEGGMDSLDHLELILEIEEFFVIEIENKTAETLFDYSLNDLIIGILEAGEGDSLGKFKPKPKTVEVDYKPNQMRFSQDKCREYLIDIPDYSLYKFEVGINESVIEALLRQDPELSIDSFKNAVIYKLSDPIKTVLEVEGEQP